MWDSRPLSGLRSTPSSPRLIRARTSSSRCGSRRMEAASLPGSKRGCGSSAPSRASSAGTTSSRQVTSDDTGLPGKPEHERPVPDPERDRSAGLDRDAPEHLLDAELGLHPADEVVRAHRHAAGRHEHVGIEAALQRRSVCSFVVRDRVQSLHLRAGRRAAPSRASTRWPRRPRPARATPRVIAAPSPWRARRSEVSARKRRRRSQRPRAHPERPRAAAPRPRPRPRRARHLHPVDGRSFRPERPRRSLQRLSLSTTRSC